MAYTPTLSDSGSATLRRISWALGKLMTKTMAAIFIKLPSMFDREMVCRCCKDPTRCSICGFGEKEAA